MPVAKEPLRHPEHPGLLSESHFPVSEAKHGSECSSVQAPGSAVPSLHLSSQDSGGSATVKVILQHQADATNQADP